LRTAATQSNQLPQTRAGDLLVKRAYQPRRPYDGPRILIDRVGRAD
jgi:hypothetical protein